MDQIIVTFIFLIALSLLLVITEMIYRKLRLRVELTRKFAHTTATLSTLSFPYLFGSHWYIFALVVFFCAVLYFSKRQTRLKSIHDVRRSSAGSYLLPVGIYVTYVLANSAGNDFMFILPILVLAISDPFAGLMGMYGRKSNYKITIFGKKLDKTRDGTLGFLISCFVISVVALSLYRMDLNVEIIGLAAGIAVFSSFVELVSGKGSDNVSVPVSVLIMLIIFL